jgi:hypothetical protein
LTLVLRGGRNVEGIRKRIACDRCFYYSLYISSSGTLNSGKCPSCNNPLVDTLTTEERDAVMVFTKSLERGTVQRLYLDRKTCRGPISYFLSLCRYYRILQGDVHVYVELKRPFLRERRKW